MRGASLRVTGLALPVLLISLAAIPAGATEFDPATIWSDPAFKQEFFGSYGIHPDVEPKMTPEERATLEKIYPLFASNPDEAIRQLEAVTNDTSTALFDFLIANLHFQADRLEPAAARYESALVKFPTFRRAVKNLGLIQVREQQFDRAIRSLTRLIQLGGVDALSYGLLGYAYSSRQDHLAAESAYRTALLLDPENVEWRLGLTRCVVRQGKHAEAAALLDMLLAGSPERADYWLLQANAYVGMGQPLKATQNLEIVDRLGSSTVESLNLLGDLYVNEKLLTLASNAYLRAIDLDPAQTPARALRAAELLASRGAGEAAMRVTGRVRKVLSAQLGEGDLRRLLRLTARTAVAEGKGEEAVAILEEVVALDPLDGDALILLGQHYSKSGDPERAILYYERAEGLEGSEAVARVRHAEVLVAQSRYEDAVPLLKRAQEIQPREDVGRYLEQVERVARARR